MTRPTTRTPPTRTTAAAAAALALVMLVLACSCGSILGVEDITVVDDPNAFTPPPNNPGGDSGAPPQCTTPAECPRPTTTPADCADVECVLGSCRYRARDFDRDGHRSNACSALSAPGVQIELGDDCDDNDDKLFPTHPRDCSPTTSDGGSAFPSLPPRGACKLGQQACKSDGTVGLCENAVLPTAEQCTTNVDEDCDGNAFNGCACSGTETQTCGSSNKGICKQGTTTCSAGKFGPCEGAIEPKARDCTSGNDNNCDGTADNLEAACACPGGRKPGDTQACDGHAQDGTGVCHAGSQTCVASPAGSSWSACAGSVGPTTEQCDGNDYDCNGVAGVNDPAPPPPAGTVNCAHLFRCDAPGRGPIVYRTGVGWTNYLGSNTIWTGYASRGDFSSGTNPPGTYRISRANGGLNMGPVSVSTSCCGASGCPTGSVFFDGAGQFYTTP